mgnify:CR=1 FL=1
MTDELKNELGLVCATFAAEAKEMGATIRDTIDDVRPEEGEE